LELSEIELIEAKVNKGVCAEYLRAILTVNSEEEFKRIHNIMKQGISEIKVDASKLSLIQNEAIGYIYETQVLMEQHGGKFTIVKPSLAVNRLAPKRDRPQTQLE
jgi:anti-anti-sigma regulatory factor